MGLNFTLAFFYLLSCAAVLQMRPCNGRKSGAILNDLLEGGVLELQFGGGVVEVYVLLAVDLVEFGVFPHPFFLYYRVLSSLSPPSPICVTQLTINSEITVKEVIPSLIMPICVIPFTHGANGRRGVVI